MLPAVTYSRRKPQQYHVVILVVVVKVVVVGAVGVVHCLQEVQIRRLKITKQADAPPFQSTLFLVQPLAGGVLGGQAQRQDEQWAGWRVGQVA